MTPWQNGRANKVVTDFLLHAKIKELCFVSSKTANVYTKHLVCARSCVKCGTWMIASFKSFQSFKAGTRSQLLCRQYGKGFKRGSETYLRKGTDPISGAHSGAGGGPRHLLRPRSAWPVRESRGPPGVGTARLPVRPARAENQDPLLRTWQSTWLFSQARTLSAWVF